METEQQNTEKPILLFDNDSQVTGVVCGRLADQGYNILVASSGAEAVKKSHEYEGDISLLLSDFQMPVMSGIELATILTEQRPKLKVLMMSGFPEGMPVLYAGWHFLASPFIGSQLRALVKGLVFPDAGSKFLSTPKQ
jgi:DNA-binding NtrC family response regulator